MENRTFFADGAMPRRAGAPTEADFPAPAVIEQYWDELRGDRLAPARREIDPKRMEAALPDAFILERISANVARFRVSGSRLRDLMGMEVRGMPLTAYFLPKERGNIGTILTQVFDTPSTARMDLVGDRGVGKPPLDAAMLLLPLTCRRGEPRFILGCLSTLGPVCRAPRRFILRNFRMKPVSHIGNEPWRRWSGLVPGGAGAGRKEPGPAAGRPQPPGEKPRLYLVGSESR